MPAFQLTQRRAVALFGLPMQMGAALLGGILLGNVAPHFAESLEPLGTAFIQAIKMVVMPLVFSLVTLGIFKMGKSMSALGRVSLISFAWFFFATFISIAVALALNGIFHPGEGTSLISSGRVPENLAIGVNWITFFIDLIPSNIIAVMAAQKVLPALIFAVLFGLALVGLESRAAPIVDVLESLSEAMFRITKWIVAAAPFAVFGIIAWVTATQGQETIIALAKLIGLMYLGLLVMMLFFFAVLFVIGAKPLTVTAKVIEPVLLAFVTRSSEVALPRHIEKLTELGVPQKVTAIVLPLGYSFNLDGSSLYIALACTFLAEAYGLNLDWAALTTILLTTLIASKGIANVPSGGLVALATVLTSIGLPVEAIAIIAGVDVFMDMGRSAINVFGNTVAVLLVRKFGASDEPNDVVAVPASAL
jgi:DAACS family dicarboxylate/amino acid:cation (Na+ or H+) symporter